MPHTVGDTRGGGGGAEEGEEEREEWRRRRRGKRKRGVVEEDQRADLAIEIGPGGGADSCDTTELAEMFWIQQTTVRVLA